DQNSVGDCYFLAPLSGVARKSPRIIRDSVVDLGDGTYAVQFFNATGAHFIRVDADLPALSSTWLWGTGFGAQESIWAPVMEKAWAFFRKGFGTYASIEGGWPTELYSALQISNVSSAPVNEGSLIARVEEMLSQNRIVSVCTKSTATDLVGRHCYVLDRCYTDSTGRIYYVLRNPWGTDGKGADSVNDGYVTISAAKLVSNITKITGGQV
ncbi:MAG: C2 family cysteine protease, partial [Tepidisphaeraceae bacterium]